MAARADQLAEYTLATLNETGVHLLEPLYMRGRQAAALTDVAEYLRTAPADIVVLLCTGRHQDWLPIQAVAELLAHGTPGPSRPIPIVAGDVPAALDCRDPGARSQSCHPAPSQRGTATSWPSP